MSADDDVLVLMEEGEIMECDNIEPTCKHSTLENDRGHSTSVNENSTLVNGEGVACQQTKAALGFYKARTPPIETHQTTTSWADAIEDEEASKPTKRKYTMWGVKKINFTPDYYLSNEDLVRSSYHIEGSFVLSSETCVPDKIVYSIRKNKITEKSYIGASLVFNRWCYAPPNFLHYLTQNHADVEILTTCIVRFVLVFRYLKVKKELDILKHMVDLPATYVPTTLGSVVEDNFSNYSGYFNKNYETFNPMENFEVFQNAYHGI